MEAYEAYLSNEKNYTVFRTKKYRLKFMAPYSLERYTEIKHWDGGYLVVMAKYKHNAEAEEDYIDLIPILENLHLDADEFIKPIKKVSIRYD